MQQNETQEGFQKGRFGHTAQEKVQIGSTGDHLIHRRLETHIWLGKKRTQDFFLTYNKRYYQT